jgi:hypothetical protein
MQLAGRRMSETVSVRLMFWLALLVIGWMARDSWEFHHTFVLTDVSTIAEPGDSITVNGHTEIVAENTWWFQRNAPPVGQAFPFTFCKDYVPALKTGNHVEVIVYTTRTVPVSCFSVRSTPLGIVYR